jgi:hypothetical protein
MHRRSSVGPPGLQLLLFVIQGLRARFARPCPWLPYYAPPALDAHQPYLALMHLRIPPPALRRQMLEARQMHETTTSCTPLHASFALRTTRGLYSHQSPSGFSHVNSN